MGSGGRTVALEGTYHQREARMVSEQADGDLSLTSMIQGAGEVGY